MRCKCYLVLYYVMYYNKFGRTYSGICTQCRAVNCPFNTNWIRFWMEAFLLHAIVYSCFHSKQTNSLSMLNRCDYLRYNVRALVNTRRMALPAPLQRSVSNWDLSCAPLIEKLAFTLHFYLSSIIWSNFCKQF